MTESCSVYPFLSLSPPVFLRQQYKIQLVQLEDDLLERLANAPDDILSDVPLIEGLEATKVDIDQKWCSLDLTQVSVFIFRMPPTLRDLKRGCAHEPNVVFRLIINR